MMKMERWQRIPDFYIRMHDKNLDKIESRKLVSIPKPLDANWGAVKFKVLQAQTCSENLTVFQPPKSLV